MFFKSKIFHFEKCHVTQGGGGGAREKCHQMSPGGGGGGSKKCQKSVTYYLNGPLPHRIVFCQLYITIVSLIFFRSFLASKKKQSNGKPFGSQASVRSNVSQKSKKSEYKNE